MLFLNIGWMSNYRGLTEGDQISGGGRWVVENGQGHEVCNFLPCPDGQVYGHVETIHGSNDRQIHLERFGAARSDDSLRTDVIWTATHPEERARRVVGWYRNATVYRHRQRFDDFPTAQHRRDGIDTYRVKADWRDATLLPPEQRLLKLSRGKGWMGQTQWWAPRHATTPIRKFLSELDSLMEHQQPTGGAQYTPGQGRTPGAAASSYVRYISLYEIAVTPRHKDLQDRFVLHAREHFSDVEENIASVDVRFRNREGVSVLGEVKPCDSGTARFAIRTAMGQLLDYGQRLNQPHKSLVILDCDPGEENTQLAIKNGFGISFCSADGFETKWPE